MCGIVGFIHPGIQDFEGKELLEAMLAKTHHRGPDFTGTFHEGSTHLGHNRLSILDLSADSNQPFHRGKLSMVFNGEVYNYLELRSRLEKEGISFKTSGDTEVILAAYMQWGPKCIESFVGMWALAILDRETGMLFCSRDRFGIKPFYFLHKGERFYFASEYSPIKITPDFHGTLNHRQIARGLQLGWINDPRESYFEDIESLPPAHNLIFHNNRVEIYRYWDLTPSRSSMPKKERAEHFRELFLNSIKLHMRSDVPVGTCLSGGIDSSSIASSIGRLYPETPLDTFTIFYSGKDSVDERPWSSQVIQMYPSLKENTYSPQPEEIKKEFHRMMLIQDLPIASSSPISQYFLMGLAKSKGVKVTLDGQGADEFLAGYMHAYYRMFATYLGGLKFGKLLREFTQHMAKQKFGPIKGIDVIAKSLLSTFSSEQSLYSLEFKRLYPYLLNEKFEPNSLFQLSSGVGNRLDNFLYNSLNYTSLTHLLHYADRNSMAFSIESRVPFLDHRLVEFMFDCDVEDKIYNATSKYTLRESMKGILPEEISNRYDKKGFVTPGEVKWLRGPLKFLLDIDYEKLTMLNIDKVRKEIKSYQEGNLRNARLVWRIATLHYWIEMNSAHIAGH